MRMFTALVFMVLLLIALAGIGFGTWSMWTAATMPGAERGMGILAAIAIGGIPFVAGTIALAGAGAIFAIDHVRVELEVARADRETLAAREVAQRRIERRQDPEFRAQVDAVKAEQAAARKEA